MKVSIINVMVGLHFQQLAFLVPFLVNAALLILQIEQHYHFHECLGPSYYHLMTFYY